LKFAGRNFSSSNPKNRAKRRIPWLRILGPILLVYLLLRIGFVEILEILGHAQFLEVVAAVVLVLPLILLKTLRWQGILRAQGIGMSLGAAFLAYFASLFIGFLTPGRLGEFVRAFYVQEAGQGKSGIAFSSVLVDRLFDFVILLLVGGAAFLSSQMTESGVLLIAIPALIVAAALGFLLHPKSYQWMLRVGARLGSFGEKFLGTSGWISQIRDGILMMRWPQFLASVAWTLLAYALFFFQAYVLGHALAIPIGYISSMNTVALGSLVALLPISISGLGTREAVIVAYLGLFGVTREMALSYSLLIFATFNLGGGLMGAIAWMLKPVPLRLLRQPSDQGVV
jgi:uncharacterized protein (TIRG00374 family)